MSWTRIQTIVAVISVVIFGMVSFVTLYYNFTPEMRYVKQPIPSNSVNSCNLEVYNNACPASLTNGTATAFRLKNTGGVGTNFNLEFYSNNAKVGYTPKVWTSASPNQTIEFPFIPYFSNILGFTIWANATCSAEILGTLGCRNSLQSLPCNYTASGNIATLKV